MYTFLWSLPALLFVFSVWGCIVNARGMVIGLRGSAFPIKQLILTLMFLVLANVGWWGMLWLINLMVTRNADPVPVSDPSNA
jgi:hypothetical protein